VEDLSTLREIFTKRNRSDSKTPVCTTWINL